MHPNQAAWKLVLNPNGSESWIVTLKVICWPVKRKLIAENWKWKLILDNWKWNFYIEKWEWKLMVTISLLIVHRNSFSMLVGFLRTWIKVKVNVQLKVNIALCVKGGPWIKRCKKMAKLNLPFSSKKFTNLYLLLFLSS